MTFREIIWRIHEKGLLIVLFFFSSLLIFLFLLLPVLTLITSDSLPILLNSLKDIEVQESIFLSLFTATITTCIAFVFGMPLAYILARTNFIGKSLVESLIDIPILIPHTVAGIALLTLFSPYAFLGRSFASYGIYFTDTMLGIIIAQLFVSLPILIKTVKEAFESVDPNLERVARTLGASNFKALFEITIPLALPGILTGFILTWARAISEFGAVIVLAYTPTIAPALIYKRYVGWGLSNARPIATWLILITLTTFLFLYGLRLHLERFRKK